MNTRETAGEAMLLAHAGEQQIAAALATKAHRFAGRIRGRLGRFFPFIRVK